VLSLKNIPERLIAQLAFILLVLVCDGIVYTSWLLKAVAIKEITILGLVLDHVSSLLLIHHISQQH
jgi:hypothetical protein